NIEARDFEAEKPEDSQIRILTEPAPNVYGHGHMKLFADVQDAILNHRKPYVDVYAGRSALELILAIYKSQKTGDKVYLPLGNFASTDMEGTFGKKEI
ncbi:MAG: hypothetical protein MJ052_01290, partial [Sphaerochaetaceae bacterium]|nr:hypothetical protein [Sphaerochaetaceae bacterium]